MPLKFFKFTGGPQIWVCPAGVTSITIKAGGAYGSSGLLGYTANPGFIQGTLAVTPGDAYYIYIGGRGQPGSSPGTLLGGLGGFNGGGLGGGHNTAYHGGSGGGGATDIRHGGTALANRVAVAAGSGGSIGGGTILGGLGGAATGGTGAGTTPNFGTGGTQSAGGTVGNSGYGGATAGALGVGGIGGGNALFDGPGGGGGGYYGGGGGSFGNGTTGGANGANNSGGGGGSNYVGGLTGSTTTQGVAHNYIDGWFQLSYNNAPYAPTLQSPVTFAQVLLAATYVFTWIYRDPDKTQHSASDFRYRVLGSSTWTTISNAVSSFIVNDGSLISYTLTATLTQEVTYEWQAACHDTGTLIGPWSASNYFIPTSTPWMKPGMAPGTQELEVYDGVTGAFISNVPGRIAPSFLDELGQGAGAMTLRLKDPTWIANPTLVKYKNIVRVKINGIYVGFWIMMSRKVTTVASEEGSALAVVISGLGPKAAWFPDAVVYPENPNNLTPGTLLVQGNGSQPKSRAFGFMSAPNIGHWYDSLQWTAPKNQSAYNDLTTWVVASATGNPWAGLPSGWPDVSANWLAWEETRGSPPSPAGYTFFRRDFYVSQAALYKFYMSGDNGLVAYLDGTQITSSSDWTTISSTQGIALAVGAHTLAIQLENFQVPLSTTSNPSAILVYVSYAADPTNGIPAEVGFFDSSGNTGGFLVIGAANPAPSWTIGDLIQTLFQESQARGVTSHTFLTYGFTEIADSYGFAWTKTGLQWNFTIGDSYDHVTDQLEAVACDIWVDANFGLQCAPFRGFDRSFIYPTDTYQSLILRDNPTHFWPMTESPAPFLDVLGTGVQFTAFGTQATGTAYNQSMPTPAVLKGVKGGVAGGITEHTLATGNRLPSTDFSTKAFAIEWWMSTTVGDFSRMDFSGAGGFGNAWSVVITDTLDSGGNLVAGYQTTTVTYAGPNNTGSISQINYQSDPSTAHYVAQYRDDGSSAVLKVYRNKVLIASLFLNPNDGWATTNIITFEMTAAGTGSYYGEAAFYKFLLSDMQIDNHYKAGLAFFNPVKNPVIFSPVANVLSADSSLEFRAKTVLVIASATQTFEYGGDGVAQGMYGRIEGYYDGSSAILPDAMSIGQATLDNLQTALTSADVAIGDDYTPWRDFGVGDWVLSLPDEASPDTAAATPTKRRIVSIGVTEDPDTRKVQYAVELDTASQNADQRLTRWLQRILPQGNLNGTIPNV